METAKYTKTTTKRVRKTGGNPRLYAGVIKKLKA